MHKTLCFYILLLLSPFLVHANNMSLWKLEKKYKKICSKVLCHKVGKRTVNLKDNETYEINAILSTPIVDGKSVTINIGETIYIEADEKMEN